MQPSPNPAGTRYPTTMADDSKLDAQTLRPMLDSADLPTLLFTAVQASGDFSLLRDEWRPQPALGSLVIDLPPNAQRALIDVCCDRLLAAQAAGRLVPRAPTMDELIDLAVWAMGPGIEAYLPLVAEELVEGDDDRRAPRWRKAEMAPGRAFQVAIIGAGESGLVTAYRLKQAGVPFVIYEKNAELGGTWAENTYPGCRVDVNSFIYSYAFARHTWSDYFSTAQDVQVYLKELAIEHGLYAHIRFNAEVLSCDWLEGKRAWQLRVRGGGRTDVVNADMLVSAVGQLNRPKLPDIAGLDSFAGTAFHSARWRHDVDFRGKRVGVIGTGASAAQFIPQLAAAGADVMIFARTRNWLLPTPDLEESVSPGARWLHDNLPNYSLWFRATLMLPQAPGFLDHAIVDPDYPPSERAVSAKNEQLRQLFADWLEPQFADRPDLRESVMPDSPVGAKRIIRDNGRWVRTLKRDNVHLVRDRIESITPRGIRCADGSEHAFDILVYGTGFEASKFLMPMTVTGRRGTNLHAVWQDDARAYLGMTMPDFPNLFCMYGPNTNLVVHGASIILFSELTAKYIVDAARLLLESGHRAMEVRREVFDTYNARIDTANRLRCWGWSGVSSWYKNSLGRSTQNYPFDTMEFWHRTHEVAAGDYLLN